MATTGKNLSLYDKAKLPNGAHYRVGIVVSEWNAEITHALRDGALQVLKDAGVPESQCIDASSPEGIRSNVLSCIQCRPATAQTVLPR